MVFQVCSAHVRRRAAKHGKQTSPVVFHVVPSISIFKYIEHSRVGYPNFIRTIYHHPAYTAAPGVRNLNDAARYTINNNKRQPYSRCLQLRRINAWVGISKRPTQPAPRFVKHHRS